MSRRAGLMNAIYHLGMRWQHIEIKEGSRPVESLPSLCSAGRADIAFMQILLLHILPT